MDKSRFLITGWPRTRTAWLAVLFNCLGVETLHERPLHFGDACQFSGWVKAGTPLHPRGLVDGFAAIAYPTQALRLFEGNPIVVVKRPLGEVLESWQAFMGRPISAAEIQLENAVCNYRAFLRSMPRTARVVEYAALDDYDAVSDVVQFCTGKTVSKPLFHFLSHTRIEIHKGKGEKFLRDHPTREWVRRVERSADAKPGRAATKYLA